MKILVTPTSMKPGDPRLKRLEDAANELVFNPTGKPLSEDALIGLLEGCEGYLAGLDQVTERVLRSCPGLKAISRYGVGYDRVDVKSADALGIPVAVTPGANAEAVGELSFAMMMSLARHIPELDASTKNGGWKHSAGMELYGKTLAIIGLGAIGKVVARCAGGLCMKVIAYDPYIDLGYCEKNGIESVSYQEAVSRADFISLHLPLLDSTRHIVNEQTIQWMKNGVILLNCSRGGLLDEEAVCRAMESGKIAGLGVDAFEIEPPGDSPLFHFPNVIATPHTGAHTKEASDNMAGMAVENLLDLLGGKECRFAVGAVKKIHG